ncbi:hypothetical protein [Halopiger goleimassiliensis]|uniref:hypothetical protein n=1 Tax=Halopiger goleimassiliensis TaxID=1293048 RepID=UPI000677F422|nr:hypothetical protein [Halopiger goleimassiliensis]
MLRKLLIAFGIFEIAKPEPVVEACERIGLENPDATERHEWALWGARLEGVVFVWLLARRESGSRLVTLLLGLAGAILVVVPGPIIELSQRFVYANTDDLELKPWVRPAARLLGALYLLVVALSMRSGDEEAVAEDGTAEATA